MNEDEDVGESCDSKPDYPCSVKQQDQQVHLVCLVCLVYPVSLV
jgi:hypothetical protein